MIFSLNRQSSHFKCVRFQNNEMFSEKITRLGSRNFSCTIHSSYSDKGLITEVNLTVCVSVYKKHGPSWVLFSGLNIDITGICDRSFKGGVNLRFNMKSRVFFKKKN